jgi:hypothetical protein
MTNQHETSTATTMATTKASAKASSKKTLKQLKSKAHKKAAAHKHTSKRIQRKQRAQCFKAFEQKLSIDMEGSAVNFRVGMAKEEPEQKGIKNKNKGKQAWKTVKPQKKSKQTKQSVLTFHPPTFVFDRDLQPSTFHPPTFGQSLTFFSPTFGQPSSTIGRS